MIIYNRMHNNQIHNDNDLKYKIGSGRTLIGQNMAKKYGLVFISTYELIKDIIRKKSKLSPIVLELVNKGQLSKNIKTIMKNQNFNKFLMKS